MGVLSTVDSICVWVDMGAVNHNPCDVVFDES